MSNVGARPVNRFAAKADLSKENYYTQINTWTAVQPSPFINPPGPGKRLVLERFHVGSNFSGVIRARWRQEINDESGNRLVVPWISVPNAKVGMDVKDLGQVCQENSGLLFTVEGPPSASIKYSTTVYRIVDMEIDKGLGQNA